MALTLTLVADGPSDEALVPLLDLLLEEHSPVPYRLVFAEPAGVGHQLSPRLQKALRDHPCDILLIHRDAEAVEVDDRLEEIKREVARGGVTVKYVCVVPVRMTESWLLVDEAAIRRAVGNPNGRGRLEIPPINRLESVDAKDVLFRALENATEHGVNRLRRFVPERYRRRVAELIQAKDALRRLPSFARTEMALVETLEAWA